MLGAGVPAMLARLLPDRELAEGAATALQRLASPDSSQAVMHAGGCRIVAPLAASVCT